MEHHFDIKIAEQYGILEAILLNNFYFWIKKNEANNKNFYDGFYWTYNSIKAFHELFPYASENKIRNALKHLEEEGFIITGNYNKSSYDRTMWYALSENAISILQNYKMEDVKNKNGECENDKPIPYNNTDNNTDNTTDIINSVIKYLNGMTGSSFHYNTPKTKTLIKARLREGFTEENFYEVISKKCKEWNGTDFEKYLRPQTLFGTKFESYLNQKEKSNNPYLDMLKGAI